RPRAARPRPARRGAPVRPTTTGCVRSLGSRGHAPNDTRLFRVTGERPWCRSIYVYVLFHPVQAVRAALMTQSTSGTAAAPPLPSPKERRRLREARSLTEEQVAAAI